MKPEIRRLAVQALGLEAVEKNEAGLETFAALIAGRCAYVAEFAEPGNDVLWLNLRRMCAELIREDIPGRLDTRQTMAYIDA